MTEKAVLELRKSIEKRDAVIEELVKSLKLIERTTFGATKYTAQKALDLTKKGGEKDADTTG